MIMTRFGGGGATMGLMGDGKPVQRIVIPFFYIFKVETGEDGKEDEDGTENEDDHDDDDEEEDEVDDSQIMFKNCICKQCR
jgi:hypothetical protein